MVKTGTAVIVHDDDLKDTYYATLAEDARDLSKRNPLVKIRSILRYPIQHAIIWPDVASEHAPVREGHVCRLRFLRFAEEGDTILGDYAESLRSALAEAIREARAAGREDILEILYHHERGAFRKRRATCTT